MLPERLVPERRFQSWRSCQGRNRKGGLGLLRKVERSFLHQTQRDEGRERTLVTDPQTRALGSHIFIISIRTPTQLHRWRSSRTPPLHRLKIQNGPESLGGRRPETGSKREDSDWKLLESHKKGMGGAGKRIQAEVFWKSAWFGYKWRLLRF